MYAEMLLAFYCPSQETEFRKQEKGKWEKTVALNNKMLERNNKAISVLLGSYLRKAVFEEDCALTNELSGY